MKKEIILVSLILLLIVSFFFYPVFKGHIPFPGDLLVNTNPYNTLSFNGYNPGAVPHKAQGTDVIRESYPWKHFVIEMLKTGEIPFWNPYNFSGNPLMANFQSGTFYPLNLIFFPLPFPTAWTLFIFLIPFMAGLFTYIYLRELKLTPAASVFGGIVFAFSSYMTVWMEYGNIGHTLLWLPLCLFIIEKYLHKFKFKFLYILILSLTISILAGYIQGYFYLLSIIVFYYFFKVFFVKKHNYINTVYFLISVISPAFIAAFQILPTLELFQNSARGNYSLSEIENLLNPWWYIITVVAPDFFGNPASRNQWISVTYIERVSYIGVIPFILALSALFTLWKKAEVRIFGMLLIFSFILAFDLIVTKYLYLLPIPVLSTTIPTRVLSIFVFSGAILSAYGIDLLLKKKALKQVLISCSLVFFILISGVVYSISADNQIALRNLVFPALYTTSFLIIYLAFHFKWRFVNFFIIALFAITLFDLFRFFHKITPFSSGEYIYPQSPVISFIQENAGINRYWGLGSAHIETNFQLYNHTFLPDGHDALHFKDYAVFLDSSTDGKTPSQISRSDSEIPVGFDAEEFNQNYRRQKLMNLLGVKYLLVKEGGLVNNPTYKPVFKDRGWEIYENLEATPRVFLTNKYEVVLSKKDVIAKFYSKNFDEKNVIVLEEEPNLRNKNAIKSQISFLKYSPNYVSISTESDTPAMLFLSDTNYPGWKAYVDGKESKIYNANYAFRSVKIPQGTHTVEFKYMPETFRQGIIISAFAIVLLFPFFIYGRKITK